MAFRATPARDLVFSFLIAQTRADRERDRHTNIRTDADDISAAAEPVHTLARCIGARTVAPRTFRSTH